MTGKVNLNRLGIQVLFIILLFIRCWDTIFDISFLNFFLKHIDELITLLMAAYLLLNYEIVLKGKSVPVLLWCPIVLLGLISGVIFRYQSVMLAMIDAFVLCSRFLIGYLAAHVYLKKHDGEISDAFMTMSKVISVVLFVFVVHDVLFTPIFPTSDFRYFMYGMQLFFPHATYLAFAAATVLIYLGYRGEGKANIIYMLMITVVGVSTMRSKAVGFFAIYWVVYIALKIFQKRYVFFMIVLGGLAAVALAWERIEVTFLGAADYSPRNVLITDGFKLMWEHFPLGTGFASFGSALAATNYSPLYTRLGYENNWGMSSDNPMFLSDSFWPAVVAQTGIIGLVLFVGLLIYFFKLTLNKLSTNKTAGLAMLMILLYLVVVSVAESAFFNPAALIMFMLFAMFEKEA